MPYADSSLTPKRNDRLAIRIIARASSGVSQKYAGGASAMSSLIADALVSSRRSGNATISSGLRLP